MFLFSYEISEVAARKALRVTHELGQEVYCYQLLLRQVQMGGHTKDICHTTYWASTLRTSHTGCLLAGGWCSRISILPQALRTQVHPA